VSSDPEVVPETQPARSSVGPRAVATLILLGCFAVGVIVGGAGDRFLLLRQGRLMPRGAADFVSRHVVDRLDHELKLSAAQRQQIVGILERRHGKVTAIWEGVRPQVRAEVNATTVEINAVLTPEQRVKFAKIRANVRRRTRWMERD
jgi:Spy/CpxP family protein refolding chaperone